MTLSLAMWQHATEKGEVQCFARRLEDGYIYLGMLGRNSLSTWLYGVRDYILIILSSITIITRIDIHWRNIRTTLDCPKINNSPSAHITYTSPKQNGLQPPLHLRAGKPHQGPQRLQVHRGQHWRQTQHLHEDRLGAQCFERCRASGSHQQV